MTYDDDDGTWDGWEKKGEREENGKGRRKKECVLKINRNEGIF
jgi:hypothetical protein